MDRAEANSIGVSVVGHAALFGLMAIAVGRAGPPQVPQPMEVSFVDEVGLTSRSPETAPPAQGMAPEAGPIEDGAPSLPAVAPPEPLPEPDLPPLTSGPRQRPEPPRQRPQRELPRATPRQAAPSPSGSGERTRRPLIGDDILKGIGRDPSPSRSQQAPAAISGEARASINAAIRRALIPCERQPLPSPEAASIRVNVRVGLNPDGSLASAEVTRVLNDNSALEIYERRMQDLALAIVRRCTPIRGLPAQYYDAPRGWRQFTYQFDPRQTR
jgi:outer membrane biosynthesis protein TonB